MDYYFCQGCHAFLSEDDIRISRMYDSHGYTRTIWICPQCGNDSFEEAIQCPECGEYHVPDDFIGDYCISCLKTEAKTEKGAKYIFSDSVLMENFADWLKEQEKK